MKNCFFCELANDKSKHIISNKHFFGIYDDKPLSKGHFLIIPKRHVSFFELIKAEASNIYPLLNRAKNLIEKKYKPDSFNIALNEGKLAGRTIPHLSIHLIPRYKGDVDNPIGTGVRAIMGTYSSPAKPMKKFQIENEVLSENELSKLRYKKDPDKKFFVGLKALVRNKNGKILCLTPKKNKRDFIGNIDLPGGRCENRDKNEIFAVQREVYEEIGVSIMNIIHFDNFIFWDVLFETDPHPTGLVLILYLADFPENSKVKLKKREHVSFKWFWPSEVADSLLQYPLRIREKIRLLER